MKGAPWAIFATILFGVSTPLAKLLLPHLSPFLMAGLLSLSLCSSLGLAGYWLIRARTTPTPITGTDLAPLNWTTQQDHQNMKEQLGITRLRPDPSGNASATNAANYDITKANPFPNLPEVLTLKNGQKVGIEGVSRFGKAALVTLAFEPRFAVVLVGSSGEGGAKLHRRNFGEAVEDLTGSGEYHWMAGNFQKYGTAESKFGSKNAGDLPVDAHELIALCAPRPTFISYGIPERGDAHWLDQQGSYMATVAAGPVFRLLGARDLGDKDDYRVAKMPPVNTDRLDGELA